MDQQKIAKHLIELNETYLDCTINTMTKLQADTQERFFRFVDKNPLFANNSADAIYAYLVSSRKRQYGYKPQVDDHQEILASYFISDHAHKGDK